MTKEPIENVGKREGPLILGLQLKKAREIIQFRPEEVGDRLNVHAKEVLDWEAERTIPSLEQLERMAKIYGREIDYFLRETPGPPVIIEFRSVTKRSFEELSEDARLIIARFDELCRTAYELELTLDKVQPALHRVPAGISPPNLALDQREGMGFGNRPIKNLQGHLAQLGVRVFELEVPPGQFSGSSYWHQDYGPCILINAKDVQGRRNFTLAHEYAHLLYGHEPSVCDIRDEGKPGPAGDERSADLFAIEFLLPPEPVRENFSRRRLSKHPSIKEIGNMAGGWNVSVQAMGYRLEELKLVEKGYTRELLESYEPPPGWGRPKTPSWERRLGKSFVENALEAYHKGHISLGKLAHCLGQPVRKAFETAEKRKPTK